jgi:hypothetical protein
MMMIFIGRADVDKLVSATPDQPKGTVSEKEEPQVSETPTNTGKRIEPEKTVVEEEESEEDEEVPAKKSKIEGEI